MTENGKNFKFSIDILCDFLMNISLFGDWQCKGRSDPNACASLKLKSIEVNKDESTELYLSMK